MICLAIGLGVLGIAAMRHARHCHGGPAWRGGWHGHHGYNHRRQGRRHRWMLHAAFDRIDASPAQERAIIAEIDKLQERVHGAKRNLKEARGDLAGALRGSVLDDAALGAVLGRLDASTLEARQAVIEAVRGIHGVLDGGQRIRIAELLEGAERGGPGWWRAGPYR